MAMKTLRSTAARLNTGLLVVAALILIGIVGLSYREWMQYQGARAEAIRSRDIVGSVGRLLSSTIDAETGQRGFVLTGEARYLEPYNRAIQAIPIEEANLRNLLPQPQEQLSNLVDQELAELRETIEVRRTQGVQAALNVVLSDRGRQLMEQIRGIAADIQHHEESMRIDAAADVQTAARRALLITAVGSLILLAFFVVGNKTINRAILAREQALGDAQNARDSLKTTIASIGDAVIATDAEGRVVFSNKVAQSLLRAREADIVGRHLDDVFRIVNEFSRATVESPVTKVLREGIIVGLANHTILIANDGTEIPIDDSGAPILNEGGPILGTVLVFRDITERRRAEQAGQLLSAIVDSSDDAIVSKSFNGVVTSWNKSAERMFGYSREEMIGQPISVLAPPDRKDEMPVILERIKRGERIDNYQTVRRTKNGELIHASVTISPVHDALGRVTGASKIVRDITAQLRAQEEVAEQRERLRVTLSSIGDAVLTTDVAALVTYLNPVAEQMTGWTSAEAAGRSLEDVFRIVNEESRRTVENPVTKVLREGGIVGLANHSLLIARDGKEISIDDSAAPIRDARGETIGVVLIFRDITERRATEQLLTRQSSELRQKTKLLESVHCLVRDLDDRIVYWNPGATDLYGFSESEALGQISHDLLKTEFPVPLDDILLQLKREGRWDGELRHRRRDGTSVIVASQWVRHRNVDGAVVSILEVNVEITERKRLESVRLELLEKERTIASEKALREKDTELARIARALAVGELAASIAHEVNQPLAGVVTNAEAGLRWLGGEMPNIHEAKESLTLIARDGNRASAVIRRIREFLKKERQETASVDMDETIREAVALAQTELLKRQIAVRLDLFPAVPQVVGDRIQLQQVILNLILNGSEAMASTDGSRELLVTSRKSSGLGGRSEILIAVCDCGVGINPQDMNRIFDAFFTTKSKGMGMGLSISRSIIEAHHGRIWAEANDGPGVTVRFSLPAESENQRSSIDSAASSPS